VQSLLPKVEFYSARDGRRLAVRVWSEVESPRARVVLLHGITSHGGWYHPSCHYLHGAGFEVHFLDRRGSGLNADERGDVAGHEQWIDDVAIYLAQVRSDRPVVLCGISWGGKLAAAVARRHPYLVQGLALLCPGLYSQFEPNALQRFALRLPMRNRMKRRHVAIPLTAKLFTDSPRWRDYVASDPLSLREVTIGFSAADLRLTRFARDSATYLRMPTLLMLAGRDRIVDNRRCREFLGRTSAVHKTLVEYSSASHTFEFEPDRQRYFADLADWIGKQTKGDVRR
jgi:alpha-beta hydrolase superfamily lysophospholipase